MCGTRRIRLPDDVAAPAAARASSDSRAIVKTIPGSITPDLRGRSGRVERSNVSLRSLSPCGPLGSHRLSCSTPDVQASIPPAPPGRAGPAGPAATGGPGGGGSPWAGPPAPGPGRLLDPCSEGRSALRRRARTPHDGGETERAERERSEDLMSKTLSRPNSEQHRGGPAGT